MTLNPEVRFQLWKHAAWLTNAVEFGLHQPLGKVRFFHSNSEKVLTLPFVQLLVLR